MASCVKLRLRNTPDNVPSNLLDPYGCVYLELDDKFSIEFDVIQEQLNDVNEIEFNRAISASLPLGLINEIILECYAMPQVEGQTYENIQIDIIDGDCTNSDNELRIDGCAGGRIEVTMILDRDHWARKMQAKSLKDIFDDDDVYVHGLDNDLAKLESTQIYNGTDFSWTPLVDYGQFFKMNNIGFRTLKNAEYVRCLTICPSYVRPFFFSKYILDKIMCCIGYTLESDYVDQEDYLRQIEYLIDPSFGTDQLSKSEVTVKASQSFDRTLTIYSNGGRGCLTLDTVVDPGGNINSGNYVSGACIDFEGYLEVTVSGLVEGDDNYWQVELVINGISFDFRQSLQTERITTNGIHVIELSAKKLNLSECNKFCIEIFGKNKNDDNNHQDFTVKINAGSTFDYIGKRKFFKAGDTYKMSDIITGKSVYDWFKSFIFQSNQKINALSSERKLTTNPAYAYNGIDGYYKEGNVIDITDKVIAKTKQLTTPDSDTERYISVSWKQSTDCFIGDQDIENELYSRVIDRGSEYGNSETLTIQNPFHEPTANAIINNKSAIIANGTDEEITVDPSLFDLLVWRGITGYFCLPKMCGDDDEGDDCYSWEIEPRILRTFGTRRQGYDNQATNACIIWYATNDVDETFLMPLAYQLPCEMGIESGTETPSGYIYPIDKNLVYNKILDVNGLEVATLFSKHYERWLQERFQEASFSYEIDFGLDEIDLWDYSALVLFSDGYGPVTARLTAILGIDRCIEKNVRGILQPITQKFSQVCGVITGGTGGGGTSSPCFISAFLTCVKNGTCFDISIDGTINGVITNVDFFIVSNGVTSPLANTSMLTAQICDLTEDVQVYAVIDRTDCDSYTTARKTIVACGDNNPEIICSGFYKSENGYCAKAEIGGQINDAFTIDSFTADGQPYIEGTDLCGLALGQIVNFEAVINFIDGCDPVTIELECLIPVQNQNCTDNIASLVVEVDDQGCCIPSLMIDCFIEQPQSILIHYFCSPTPPALNEMGCLWNGKDPICCEPGDNLYLRAIVFFCDCNPYCIEWQEYAKEPCECLGVIVCDTCIASIDPSCEGYVWDWYQMLDETDKNAEPNKTVSQIESQYTVYDNGENNVILATGIEVWYSAIGKKQGCEDVVLYYFHDIADVWDSPTEPIKI